MGRLQSSGMARLDLMEALVEGAFDEPMWSRFLEGLRTATAADHAVLIFHPPGRPMDQGVQLVAGADAPAGMADLFRKYFYPTEASPRDEITPGKVVSLAEVREAGGGRREDVYGQLVEDFGLASTRIVRVAEPRGVEGWLLVVRRDADFGDEVSAMLAGLAGPLRAVLRVHVAGESDRFRARMASEAVRRLQCGWILLDAEAHILAADSFGDTILAGSGVLGRTVSGRLSVRPAKLEREIFASIAKLASGGEGRPRAISLRGDPWLDMLLLPARKKMVSDTAFPSVIAYVHADNWRTADRCAQLSDLFHLSPSEARLALALCHGKSIAGAAVDLGLSVETARSYSKSIYAKTGTSGMVDLVRIIMGSILTLAPDD